MKISVTKLLFGLAAIAYGALYLLKAASILPDITFNGWWTLFLIIPCLSSVIVKGIKFLNLAGLTLGCWLLLKYQGIISEKVSDAILVAAILILLGLFLIFGSKIQQIKWLNDIRKRSSDSNDRPEYLAIFSQVNTKNNSLSFGGGELSSIFGKLSVDLSDARPSGDIIIEVSAIFGGVEIILPPGVRVETKGLPILGGCTNFSPKETDSSLPLIKIEYTAVFGGIEIRS